MRRPRIPFLLLAFALLPSCGKVGPTVPFEGLAPPFTRLPLGKTVQFIDGRFDPATAWSVAGGPGRGIVSSTGLYHAPYFAPADSSVQVLSIVGADTLSATVEILDVPPDTVDCCGLRPPGPVGEYIYVEELPEAIVRVPPVYPDAAREAGVEGTVMVQVRVCIDGQVMESHVVRSVPMLDEAAVEATRQWVFKPALSEGRPVSVWVAIPVRFSLH